MTKPYIICLLWDVYDDQTESSKSRRKAVFLEHGLRKLKVMPRILFVSGFHPATRARDLAYEFERYALHPLSRLFFHKHPPLEVMAP